MFFVCDKAEGGKFRGNEVRNQKDLASLGVQTAFFLVHGF